MGAVFVGTPGRLGATVDFHQRISNKDVENVQTREGAFDLKLSCSPYRHLGRNLRRHGLRGDSRRIAAAPPMPHMSEVNCA